jgi:hypothetical protein
VGPGYRLVPEDWNNEDTRTRIYWEHCQECNCEDTQPDLQRKVLNYWLDQNFLGVFHLFLKPYLEQNHQKIDEEGKFTCTLNGLQKTVLIYGPGEDVLFHETGHTFMWQIEGTSHIEYKDGATKTLKTYDKIIVEQQTKFKMTRGQGARVIVIVMD